MKPCVNCKYYSTGFDFGQYCQSPNNGISLVTGKIVKKPAIYRTDPLYNNSVCGVEGKWFVRKPFWKFWS